MKKLATVLFVMAFVLGVVSPMVALAVQRDAAHDAVGGSMKTVGEAAKGTVETGVSPIVAFWRSITGRGKPEKIVTDPVEKGGKTVYDASVNTGKTITGQSQTGQDQ